MISSGIWSGVLGAGGLIGLNFVGGVCEGIDEHGEGDEPVNTSNNSDDIY